MKEPEQNSISDPYDEINLKELFNVLWAGKKIIILITSVFAICSVIYALQLSNYYKSESLLSVRSESAPNLGSLSQFSGLASMAGINLPSASGDQGMKVIETIKSRAFLKHLLTFEDVLPSIMAAKRYDFESKQLIFDPEIYNVDKKTWVRKPEDNKQAKPSYLEAHQTYSGEMLSISQDKTTNIISVSVEHISPIFAKEFLDLIFQEANTLLRNKDLEESTSSLEYLKSEITKTSLLEIKDSINLLIQAQLETQMMSKIRKDYVLQILEPPFVPEKKSKPNRAMTCIFGTMLGGMFSVLLVLIRRYVLDSDKQE